MRKEYLNHSQIAIGSNIFLKSRKLATTIFLLYFLVGNLAYSEKKVTETVENASVEGLEVNRENLGSRFAFGFDFGLGIYNGTQVPKPLPFKKYAVDSKTGLSVVYRYRFGEAFGFYTAPGYAYTGYHGLFYVNSSIFTHSLLVPAGFEVGPFGQSGYSFVLGALLNYEFSSTLVPTQGLSTGSGMYNLSNQDMARPGYGIFIGQIYRLQSGEGNQKELGVPVIIEIYKSTLNHLYAGIKVGIQYGRL